MKRIKLATAVVALTKNGQTYEHLFTMNVSINNPVQNQLDNSPQGVGDGFSYKTGLDQPVTASLTLRHISGGLARMLKQTYKDGSRVDFVIYDKETEDSYTMNESVITTDPRNKTISEGAESFSVTIGLQCSVANFDDESGADSSS